MEQFVQKSRLLVFLVVPLSFSYAVILFSLCIVYLFLTSFRVSSLSDFLSRLVFFSLTPKGGRTPTASRQASRHEIKDAVLLHSWFRLESAHRSSTCLRLITSSLVDDTTSSSEEDIWMYMWLKLRKRRKRKWIHDFNESYAQHGAYVLARLIKRFGEIPVLLSNVPRIL
jgi:hypothetical protein